MTKHISIIRDIFSESVRVKQELLADEKQIRTIYNIACAIAESIKNGGKLLICGNGGSAADAQHLAAELLVRLRSDVNRKSIPAIPLALDSSSMTACANDYGYEYCYSRMVEGLGNKDDVLMGITTSGSSANVIKALQAAREKGIKTIGLLGGDGFPAKDYCDLDLTVPARDTARVQETHITAGHAIMLLVEEMVM